MAEQTQVVLRVDMEKVSRSLDRIDYHVRNLEALAMPNGRGLIETICRTALLEPLE